MSTMPGGVSPLLAQIGLGPLFYALADAVIVGSVDTGQILLWNPAAARMFGLSAENAIGQPIDIIVPEDLRALHHAGMARYQESGHGRFVSTSEPMAIRALRQSGEEFLAELTLTPIGTPDAPSNYVLAILRDVSRRKRAEALLARQQARLAEAQRIAHVGSWEWNPSRNTIDGSEELYRIAGLGCGEPAPTLDAYLNWFHPEDRGEVARTITEALAARQPFSYEARIVRPDGGIRHVHANGLVEMDATGVPKVVGTIEDVTERREKDEALLRSSALLEAEQEATPDGVLVVDEDRVVLDVNRRFVELWNIPPHLVERRSDRELLEHVRPQIKDWQSFLARVEELYRQPTALAQDEILLADGRVFERYSSPVVSPAGQYLGRVWYFRDISERKRIEAKLQQQYDQLRELDRIKDDFLHAVSHDLRTPLSSIRGYSEFLADDLAGSLSPGQREYVAQIEKGAIRLEGMVNDLLDFARIEAGTFRLDCGQTDLRALIRGVADSLRPLIEEAKLTLTVSLPETPLTANLDSERIERVLFNLLTNAIKFTERGGRIALRARAEGPHLLCEIVDTGIGIAKEDLAKLFRRFSQLDTGRNKRGGTGLGLSISKAIVEAHGGTIGVSSEPGSGSTFWFRLPVQSTVCTPSDAAGES